MIRKTVNPVRIAALVLVSVLAFAVAPAASAHTSLISEAPSDGDVITELTDVNLVFSEELLDLGSFVTLTDAGGTTTDLDIDLSVPRELNAPLPADLAAGDYVIDWRVVANDGHPLEHSIAFTFAPVGSAGSPLPSTSPSPPLAVFSSASAAPSASAAAPESSTSAPSASSEPTDEASVVPISATDEDSSGTPVWWWIIGIGLIVGAIVGFAMWRAGSNAGSKKSGGGDATQP